VNRNPNPKIIGAFVSASLVLLVAMILFFGSAGFLGRNVHFILFFDQSVNGLKVGSPVKFRGVPVGSVERIQIRAEGQDPDSRAIPVVIQIDRSRLEQDLGVSTASFGADAVLELVSRGLVAQLSTESLITGQLFVEFSFEPGKVQAFRPHLVGTNGMVEVPTFASPLDQITDDLVQLISNASAVDLKRLSENVNVALENLAVVLEGIDSKGISASVTTAADKVTAFVGSEEFDQSLATMRTAFEDVRSAAKSFNLETGSFGATVDIWTKRFGQTLDKLDGLTAQTTEIMEPESSLRYELENTLRELSRAAQSVRLFTDYLERNPNALITGRPDQSE
jgi:paraquat-inducible protein B